jgi:hypothetical protein
MPNTAQIARDLPTQARIDLLRIVTEPHRIVPCAALIKKKLVNVTDGEASLSELGMRVVRHLDAGHQVQMRGRFLRIIELVLAAHTAQDDIEQAFREKFTPAELDQLTSVLAHVGGALRQAVKESA